MSAPSPHEFIRVVPDDSTRTFTTSRTDRFGANCTQKTAHIIVLYIGQAVYGKACGCLTSARSYAAWASICGQHDGRSSPP